MRLLKIFLALILVISFGQFCVNKVSAQATQQSFISIVNPLRISSYTKDSAKSISAEYEQVKNRNLPATWLLDYKILNNESSLKAISTFDKKQELGLLFEVSPEFANAAGVAYNQSDSWHRSNSIFLNGYKQEDRIKMIDFLFDNFKKEFGYYPKSVGAWWIDSFSLKYMSDKYGIIANLNVADQMGTDGYTVWGGYWSTPYYPSNINALFPANSEENKIPVVTMRWAPRDPINGYISPDEREATRFSTQDHDTVGLGYDFFENLIRLYLSKDFGHVVIGLEGDYDPQSYTLNYDNHLSIAQKMESEGVRIVNMRDYADLYKNKFNNLSPEILLESSDILGSSKRIYWYHNTNYRIGILYDVSEKSTKIIDLRSFYKNLPEAFYTAPNSQPDLFQIAPAIIDFKTKPNTSIDLDTGALIQSNDSSITFEKGKIVFSEDGVSFDGVGYEIQPEIIEEHNLILEGNTLKVPDNYEVSGEGMLISEVNPKIPYAIKYRVPSFFIYLGIIVLLVSLFLLLIFIHRINKNYSLGISVFIAFGVILYVFVRLSNPLHVSQSEIDSLKVLKKLPEGRVLLYDKDCLKCKWATERKPAAMEGRKDYVNKLSRKPIVYSLDYVIAKNPEEAVSILEKENIRYLYLTKYEGYVEALSFDPKSLGIEKVYENANSVIYEVLKMSGS
jgi:hypothetical protein